MMAESRNMDACGLGCFKHSLPGRAFHLSAVDGKFNHGLILYLLANDSIKFAYIITDTALGALALIENMRFLALAAYRFCRTVDCAECAAVAFFPIDFDDLTSRHVILLMFDLDFKDNRERGIFP